MDSRVLLKKGYAPLPVPSGQKYPKGMNEWQKVTDWKGRRRASASTSSASP